VTARATFRKSDLDRAVKVMVENGYEFGGFEFEGTKVRILSRDQTPQLRKRQNSVDKILGS
jgi:hypothetical protein